MQGDHPFEVIYSPWTDDHHTKEGEEPTAMLVRGLRYRGIDLPIAFASFVIGDQKAEGFLSLEASEALRNDPERAIKAAQGFGLIRVSLIPTSVTFRKQNED